MKIVIAGGRNFIPTNIEINWLKNKLEELKPELILSGGAKGADRFGEEIAFCLGIPVKLFKADWDKYGPFAGPIRNKEMIDETDAIILFPGGKGTADAKKKAIEKGIKIIEYVRKENVTLY